MVHVVVFDRIFDGDDVFGVASIDHVNQRGNSGCFSRSCGTADEDQSRRQTGERFHPRRQRELVELRGTERNGADAGGASPTLPMKVDTKSSE
jgi:hypothetical protein